MIKSIFIILNLLIFAATAYGRGTYQEPADFIAESFDNTTPAAKIILLTDEIKNYLENILQHPYQGNRIRYWQQDDRTAWILDETGKSKPITTGIVIEDNKIVTIKVLIFRESRGWEVRHRFFTKQYIDASIDNNHLLDRTIDGISGATLSVRALTKQARAALLLTKIIQQQ